MRRCGWCKDNELYIKYHDEEWGIPNRCTRALFEFLILEGAQAGLSWITILKKRENYRLAYDGFDPEKIARYDDRKIALLLKDEGIIRNRLKIESAIKNARAFLELEAGASGFMDHLWSFVDGEPVQNRWRSLKQIPVSTSTSDAMSKDLKKRGFNFFGTRICYAFMQATGMVNDHLIDCHRYLPCQQASSCPEIDKLGNYSPHL
ncbi:MAG: DNA-3-methyladenine glycosylase I [Gammaproteobacteria bacterium]|nr:DNA-3-methyladenine glycosylase I [Gammaproteobacteria bacterium]